MPNLQSQRIFFSCSFCEAMAMICVNSSCKRSASELLGNFQVSWHGAMGKSGKFKWVPTYSETNPSNNTIAWFDGNLTRQMHLERPLFHGIWHLITTSIATEAQTSAFRMASTASSWSASLRDSSRSCKPVCIDISNFEHRKRMKTWRKINIDAVTYRNGGILIVSLKLPIPQILGGRVLLVYSSADSIVPWYQQHPTATSIWHLRHLLPLPAPVLLQPIKPRAPTCSNVLEQLIHLTCQTSHFISGFAQLLDQKFNRSKIGPQKKDKVKRCNDNSTKVKALNIVQ